MQGKECSGKNHQKKLCQASNNKRGNTGDSQNAFIAIFSNEEDRKVRKKVWELEKIKITYDWRLIKQVNHLLWRITKPYQQYTILKIET